MNNLLVIGALNALKEKGLMMGWEDTIKRLSDWGKKSDPAFGKYSLLLGWSSLPPPTTTVDGGVDDEAMAAVGRPGSKESLPAKLQARETPNDRRKATDSIHEGAFGS